MWNSDINIDIIAETLIDDFERNLKMPSISSFEKSLQELHRHFPNASQKELIDIINLVCTVYSHNTDEKCELVITAPTSFKLKAKKTKEVIDTLITHAHKSITITGYSISDYFNGMLDNIIQKSTTGIYVNLYVNDSETNRKHLHRIKSYRGQYLQLFKYNSNRNDKIAALHAKLIVVDKNMCLISSANLSYHGMQGNIEMGILIHSTAQAENIEELLKELLRMKIFLPVTD